jgi:hypothetical protein
MELVCKEREEAEIQALPEDPEPKAKEFLRETKQNAVFEQKTRLDCVCYVF